MISIDVNIILYDESNQFIYNEMDWDGVGRPAIFIGWEIVIQLVDFILLRRVDQIFDLYTYTRVCEKNFVTMRHTRNHDNMLTSNFLFISQIWKYFTIWLSLSVFIKLDQTDRVSQCPVCNKLINRFTIKPVKNGQ